MGLKETFQKAAQTAVKAFGNIAQGTTYESFASSPYNASAGTASTVFASAHDVDMVIGEFSFTQVDGINVMPQDKRAFVPKLDISGVCEITPKPKDRIITDACTDASANWQVVNVSLDAADALYILQIRRP